MKLKFFFCQFPNPWTLRVSGMGGFTSKCEKKSKSLHPKLWSHGPLGVRQLVQDGGRAEEDGARHRGAVPPPVRSSRRVCWPADASVSSPVWVHRPGAPGSGSRQIRGAEQRYGRSAAGSYRQASGSGGWQSGARPYPQQSGARRRCRKLTEPGVWLGKSPTDSRNNFSKS